MGEAEQGKVVLDYHIGNARVKIIDTHCRHRTAEEIEAILQRIARRVETTTTASEPFEGPQAAFCPQDEE